MVTTALWSRSSRPGAAVLAGAALLLGAATGCSLDDGPSRAPDARQGEAYTASAPVVQPGRPGEPATTLAPGDVGTRRAPTGANRFDVGFVQMMRVHHLQALRMAALAEGRAGDARVRALARRVSAAQAPEVAVLDAWLAARDQERSSPHGHGHAGMPGAISDEQLERLARAGGDFDRRFLDLMIRHHRGAVQMAEAVATSGTDPAVQELAAEVASGQTAEIGRMRDLQAHL